MLLWTGGSLLGLIALLVLALCALTWWYNPERLARLISREASKQINADVSLSDVNYTLWSSFPHLNIEVDSVHLRSRNFDSIAPALRAQLGPDADFLLSARKIKGGVNLLRLFSGRIYLKNIDVQQLRVNLVAATDSLNNFDIVPSGPDKTRIPYFHIDSLRIANRGDIVYRSIPSATTAAVGLRGASLKAGAHHHHADEYDLIIDGIVDVSTGGTTFLHDFPFGLSGDVGIRFDPFAISTTDYKVALGNITSRLTMDMNIGDGPSLDRFAYSMQHFTMRDLMSLLPPGNYPALDHLDADLSMDASARLTSKYEFSSAYLPSFEVDFHVPEGRVAYTFTDGRRYALSNVTLDGRLAFDGRDPAASFISVPEFHMKGDGVAVDLSGRISDITGNPVIEAQMTARGDMQRLSDVVGELKPYGLTGEVTADANVSFRLENNTLYGAIADLKVGAPNVSMNYGGTRVEIEGLTATTDESYDDGLTEDVLLSRIPLRLDVGARGLRVADRASGVRLDASGVKAAARLGRENGGVVKRRLELDLSSDVLSVKSPAMQASLSKVAVGFTGDHLSTPVRTPAFHMPEKWNADERTRSFAHHTPAFLTVSLPAQLRQLMAEWRPALTLTIAGGSAGTASYPHSTRIGRVSLRATADTIHLDRLTLGSGATHGILSARVRNLRQFLNSPVPAPLYVDLQAEIDTVQINQLAREYTRRNPHSAIARGDTATMAKGPDSVAFLIPRNLVANVKLHAKQTRYINLHLYDLLADVRLADGRADIDTMSIAADFGAAGMNLMFDTSDMQDMQLGGHLDIAHINIVKFFDNFHKLTEMMPEAKNFSGNIAAAADMRMRIFPSMFLNVPSVWANARVEAWDLQVKQSPFLKRVTRMLLLPGDEPIDVKDITVHAGIHSNLLEVFPFEFEMSKYKLVLSGLNNFNGGLYYHVGIVDWPLKIPFGINIKGDFHNPQLRFGGKDWHDINGARVASGVNDNNRINLNKLGRRYAGEFVHTAATYQGD